MSNLSSFNADWVSPPGATLLDFMEEQGKTLRQLANEMECSISLLKNLSQGSIIIDSDLANTLSQVTGVSTKFWLSREEQYRENLKKVSLLKSDESEWLSNLPTADMVNLGWIQKPDNKARKLITCLDYFGVVSVDHWRSKYANMIGETAFRISDKFSHKQESIASWLRQGEIQVSSHHCLPWDKDKLIETIPNLRSLTKDPNPVSFIPKLRALLADCGVLLAIVRSPRHCPASGAAYWLGRNKPLIIMSFKYLTDDHFWFTFFHEIGHLVLHPNYSLILETSEATLSDIEDEANKFSENILIPTEYERELQKLNSTDLRGILKLARKIGVSNGIVVGQLQHKSIIPKSALRKLKVSYSWKDLVIL
ncbi:ImmA/IrrE family metallo-endopeptidase [Cellvibrio sp. PSBB006]|uniref:ImmA/IrrE family metallo-endopeptidase n=1 Tax=Cellvibrio sp. PSBB006 TaxID=1987723 RepID=UPI000B3B8099|nr:ImmA/IrrE family metallo-endopeptidase [Cellvibrio sp. PSBB006]ARU28670.1 hypothetical protein CBR65_15125 [Cellvibrio sp. PSBB006]